MKNVIVTTTINHVTPEILKYDAINGWHLIVTGDRKSPAKYDLKNGTFYSWEEQESLYPEICKLVGPDNTMRGRMIALLIAANEKPDLVAMIDDDCMPYSDWPGKIYIGESGKYDYFPSDLAFDPGTIAYGAPSRGFPPQLYSQKQLSSVDIKEIHPLLQSNLCDGQADVDAVFRLHGKLDWGLSRNVFPMWSNGFSIINPMHTIILGSVLKDYCGEIPFVGHVCDIWAGYLFQARHPNSTLYCRATARHWQNRSYESVLSEVEDEIYSYRYGLDFLKGLKENGPEHLDRISCLPLKSIESIELYRSYFK